MLTPNIDTRATNIGFENRFLGDHISHSEKKIFSSKSFFECVKCDLLEKTVLKASVSRSCVDIRARYMPREGTRPQQMKIVEFLVMKIDNNIY